jgi:hypothetical protein
MPIPFEQGPFQPAKGWVATVFLALSIPRRPFTDGMFYKTVVLRACWRFPMRGVLTGVGSAVSLFHFCSSTSEYLYGCIAEYPHPRQNYLVPVQLTVSWLTVTSWFHARLLAKFSDAFNKDQKISLNHSGDLMRSSTSKGDCP